MGITVKQLERSDLQDNNIVFQYESPGHYKVGIHENPDGWTIVLKKEEFEKTFIKRENEKLITPYKGDSEVHAAFLDGAEAGLIQFEFQEHNKSVRVWDIDVLPELRRKGVGKRLMILCKERSKELGARRIILETQTSNLKAIAFYRAMGFILAGLDASHYHNDDIARNEVRLEMVFYLGITK